MWGSVIETAVWAFFSVARWPGRTLLQCFAGFFLIANGVYVGAGWTMRAGGAADLVRYGTPIWVLITFGVVATCGGVVMWTTSGRVRSSISSTRSKWAGIP